jgi:uncharacterized protein
MSERPVAMVTGASSGLGATFARKLAARGFDLILLARRADRLERLSRELPGRAEPLAANLVTDAGISAAERAIFACGHLEMLVNNAGFGTLGRFWEAQLPGQEDMHRLHVLAPMRLTHAALAGMVARARGAVINVSSVAAFSPSPGNVSYCSTKAWMNSFTEGLDMELRSIRSPVQVQALCPGYTVTDFHDTLGIDRANIPRFLWMSADEVVETSLRSLGRRKVVVVPGWKYQIGAVLMRHLPYAIRRRAGRPGRDRRV